MVNYTIIGENLAALREKRGLTQESIAEYLDVSRPVISYYETGERNIPLIHLEKLADLYSVDIEDLMSDSPLVQQAAVAFAFRTDGLRAGDLKCIAEFQKIIKNYLKMQRISQHEEK